MKHDDPYKEALRYIDNARETLKLAGKDGKYYEDDKYVRTASGTAYLGLVKALDFYLNVKGVPKKRGRKSIEYYQHEVAKLDKKILNHLNTGYRILHIDGYYEGEKKIKVIDEGLDSAISIIEAIKQYSNNGVSQK